MLRFAKPDTARSIAPGTSAGYTDTDVYDRHAGNVYRQALFTLGDTDLAEQVVSDVIVAECVRPAAVISGQDAERLLAVSAYRRCMELTGNPAWTSRGPARRARDSAGCVGLGGLTAGERGVLGLVLVGVVGYRQAGVDLGIPARHVAALLRAALGNAAAAEPDSRPCAGQERAWP